MQEQKNDYSGQVIDLSALAGNFLKVLGRLWLVVVLLGAMAGGLFFWRAQRSYAPVYEADALLSVRVLSASSLGSSYYYDSQMTRQIVDSFDYIIRSEGMQDRLRLALGEKYGRSSIYAAAIGESSLIRLRTRSTDSQAALDTLNAVILHYPQVAAFVIGDTQLSIVKEATVGTEPVNALSVRSAAIKGVVLGLGIGIALVLLLSLGRKTVRCPEDLQSTSSLTCLGSVPFVVRKRRRKRTQTGPMLLDSRCAEQLSGAFGALQVKLLRRIPAGDSGGRIILVTSTGAGEGKTTLSCNLAIALAKSGRKVILVDGDLRQQSVKERLGLTHPSAGLAELYRAPRADVKRVLLPVADGLSLSVVAGDTRLASPMGILDSPKMEQLLGQLRPLADYIVLDAPPSGGLADASVLSQWVDAVLYVVRYDGASRGQIASALENLSDRGAPLCGFVLNGIPARKTGYGYGKYGYGKYGYGYGKYGYGQYGRRSGERGSDREDR